LIYDPGHEYFAHGFTDEVQFYNAINAGAAGPLVLRPPFDQDARCRWFGRFCRAALAIARSRGRCNVVVDELQLVTEPGRAPAEWGELVLTGRKFGVQVMAASIRPALIDKNFWTVATHVRTGRLNFSDDQQTMARSLNVPIADVQALSGFQFISRNMLTGEIKRG
jgi:hypothetical protein